MDPIAILQEFGFPVLIALSLGYLLWKQQHWIQDELIEELEERYRFEKCVNLKERGYTYYPMGKYLKIGKLVMYHGHHFAGIQHTRNHLMRLGCNIMYGHHHDIQQSSVTHIDGQK